MPAPNIETIVSLSKRRGFVFPASDIYGGLGSHHGITANSALSLPIISNEAGGTGWFMNATTSRASIRRSFRTGWCGNIPATKRLFPIRWSIAANAIVDACYKLGRLIQELPAHVRAALDGSEHALYELKSREIKCSNRGPRTYRPKPFNLMFRTTVGAAR